MFVYLNKRGQGTLEYGIIIAVIVAALIAMQVYIKRGLQGRLRQASDDIGEQYSPGATSSKHTTTTTSDSTETTRGTLEGEEDSVRTETLSTQKQEKTGSETVGESTEEYWKPSSETAEEPTQ